MSGPAAGTLLCLSFITPSCCCPGTQSCMHSLDAQPTGSSCVHCLPGCALLQVNSICLSPDGDCIASGAEDKTVKLWRISSQECFLTLTGARCQCDQGGESAAGLGLAITYQRCGAVRCFWYPCGQVYLCGARVRGSDCRVSCSPAPSHVTYHLHTASGQQQAPAGAG